jgi:uncharacterized membrane protein YphA (DoxX/SURF4 family)
MPTGKNLFSNHFLKPTNMNLQTISIWVLRLVAAVIMLQTLYFKFTGAEESIFIFSQLGMEPWGRIGTGVMELIASVLILYPRTTHLGALLGIGLMSGAIFFHLTKLGIEIKGDGGLLFYYASAVFVSCGILLIIYRNTFLALIKK